MEEVSEHVGMNYPEIPDSRFVAQTVDGFLFPLEQAGSAKNPITIDKDEGFSETMTPPALQQTLQPSPSLHFHTLSKKLKHFSDLVKKMKHFCICSKKLTHFLHLVKKLRYFSHILEKN